MAKLKVGVIGLGVGESHLDAFIAHSACEVKWICDFEETKLAKLKSKYPQIAKCTKDANQVLTDPEVNVVAIASYDDQHFGQMVTAIKNNKHLFVEKPLCLYFEEATQIKQLLQERSDLRLSSNLILRKSPRFLDLRDRVNSGSMGQIYFIEGDYNYGRLHKILNGWRGKIDGYSPIFGGGVHIIDLFLWITGKKVVEVSAIGSKLRTHNTGYRYFDTVVSTLKFEDGSLGRMSVNLGSIYPHFHRFSVYGSKATFENGLENALWFTPSLEEGKEAAPEKLSTAYPGVKKGDFVSNFVDTILGKAQPEITTQEVFDSMSVCFAIEKASRQTGPVAVTYI